jgi:RNA polymerase sigma-70 factor (ECF subfamily)
MSTSKLNFEELCLPNRSDLLGLAINLTKNKADAEDLLQQTFQLALSNWDSFDAEDNIELHARAWLFCILRNRFMSNYRRAKNKARNSENMHVLIVEGIYGKSEEDEVQPPLQREKASLLESTAELSGNVLAALKTLSEEQREVIVRYADGEKYVDIAAALDIPIGTVMSRLFRARKALASSLREYAAKEYRIRGTVKRVPVEYVTIELEVETSEREQPEADSVQGIMGGDYDGPFFVR